VDLELKGTVILVTGGSAGLGAATCRRLVEEGARVCLCARGAERLEGVADELKAAGGDVLPVVADVSEGADLERFVTAAYERWGRIDGLVNNAGETGMMPFESIDYGALRADLDLKLSAAVRTAQLALPHLREGGGGVIVNTLGTLGKTPLAGSAPTALSRAAGLALVKLLSKELGDDRIRVNAAVVGLFESHSWESAATELGRSVEELYAEALQESDVPLGRMGKPEEFADLVAFLLSDRSRYISGATINIDGGLCPTV
jgi:NAD(P)-dependent dehydrogenase (short-subunit alcohol dehydrogenase family)